MIIGIDPGPTTGIAIWDGYWTFMQIKGIDLIGFLQEHASDIEVVICENFIKRNNPGADLSPLEYIGFVKSFCISYDKKLVLQTPAKGKAFWTNEKLKACGIYTTGLKHSMDATRHVLTYMLDVKMLPLAYYQSLRHLTETSLLRANIPNLGA